MTTTDFRALCAELADELTQFNAWYIEDNGYGLPNLEALLRRCDAALAKPEPEGPTDEGLMEVFWDHQNGMEELWADDWPAAARAVLARWGNPAPQPPAPVTENPTDEDLLNLHDWMTDEWAANHDFELPPIQYARAVLARWGNPAPQPPDNGEVANEVRYLVYELRDQADDLDPSLELFGLIHNAADLLQSLSPPQPVPVSERLPGQKDYDAEGRCWVWWKNGVRWVLDEWTHQELREGPLSDYVSHWLPAHALPLPTAND